MKLLFTMVLILMTVCVMEVVYCKRIHSDPDKPGRRNRVAKSRKDCPCKCTREKALICGTDGSMYTKCTLECAQCKYPEKKLEEAPNEECMRKRDCPCKCSSEEKTVCGTDRRWYSQCGFKCAQCKNPDKHLEVASSTKKCRKEKRCKGRQC